MLILHQHKKMKSNSLEMSLISSLSVFGPLRYHITTFFCPLFLTTLCNLYSHLNSIQSYHQWQKTYGKPAPQAYAPVNWPDRETGSSGCRTAGTCCWSRAVQSCQSCPVASRTMSTAWPCGGWSGTLWRSCQSRSVSATPQTAPCEGRTPGRCKVCHKSHRRSCPAC